MAMCLPLCTVHLVVDLALLSAVFRTASWVLWCLSLHLNSLLSSRTVTLPNVVAGLPSRRFSRMLLLRLLSLMTLALLNPLVAQVCLYNVWSLVGLTLLMQRFSMDVVSVVHFLADSADC